MEPQLQVFAPGGLFWTRFHLRPGVGDSAVTACYELLERSFVADGSGGQNLAGFELAVKLLGDRESIRNFWLIPLQDLLSLATWLGGFVGREIIWRGERYRLLEEGRFEPVVPRQQ